MQSIEQLGDIETCVERILQACGDHVVLATPLGLGKPNRLINALYRRIAAEPSRRLTIHTALSLRVPEPQSDLERRFAEPFLARHFGNDYPHLEYAVAMAEDRLPPNVKVHEFYFQSGAMLDSGQAQRNHASLNYTMVAKSLVDTGINVIAQLVARRGQGAEARYSLGCNPDITLDLMDLLSAAGARLPMFIGVVHEALPFLGGDADVGAGTDLFDIVLDAPDPPQTLFALPRKEIDDVEYAIGLHASTLVRDGGTLQIGIGALSDALVHSLLLRQRDNVGYCDAIDALCGEAGQSPAVLKAGGRDPFKRGIHGSSEMVMDGFMHLRRAGILVRKVYEDLALQRVVDEGAVGDRLESGDVLRLRSYDVLPARVGANELERLVRFGILPQGCRLEDDRLHLPDGSNISTDLDNPESQAALGAAIHGRDLIGGRYLNGGFCLGSKELYLWLSGLEGEDFEGLSMNRISEINQLQRGYEALARRQHRQARFFNTCMIATALGAAASDALEDGRVVSGVGGQYNFVALAHELDDARSVLMLRSTRLAHGKLTSNIRWNYAHTTIPRHLRDIYVSEYGIADLRGKSDEECVIAMLAISDARFHQELVEQAIKALKLPADFRVPSAWSQNTPAILRERLGGARARGLLPAWPFGSDFTPTELRLLAALGWLKSVVGKPGRWSSLLGAVLSPGPEDADGLARMGLERPQSLRDRLMARLLNAALRRTS
ncbi:acetyl-CoA hydrolase/transferase C-terminal domain-containing protein [Dokdonella sp.]|uniref:acetyl-CoA hydrolase/transferase C-terminal domain-containing protein n=1 Tax=Dokdonella sp. TaxID=2291710 RepID=UPI0035273B09